MSILRGILSESKEYYIELEKDIKRQLNKLPKGSIKKRKISGKIYYYLQQRIDDKVAHKYLGKEKPEEIIKQINKRKALKSELKKVKEALKLLKKS